MARFPLRLGWLLALFLSMHSLAASSSYHIGNSLTFQNGQRTAFGNASAAYAGSHVWGSHIDLGQSLLTIVSSPTGFDYTGDTGGAWPDALADHTWDAVICQPYVGSARTESIAAATLFGSALSRSPATRLYIYEVWPQFADEDRNTETWWEVRNGLFTQALSKAYFDQIRTQAEAQLKNAREVRIVPVGSVLAAIQSRIEAGTFDGLDSVLDLYTDHVHLNEEGSFIVVSTWLATVHRVSPAVFDLTNAYPSVSASFAAEINDVILQVVQQHPYSGFSKPFSPLIDWSDAGDGWKYSESVGYYIDDAFPWIYHLNWGWLHVQGENPQAYYLYSPTLESWLYTSSTLLHSGWVYEFSTSQWSLLTRDVAGVFWIYRASSDEWSVHGNG